MRKTRLYLFLPFVLGFALKMQINKQDRTIQQEIIIHASIKDVWDAWTAKEGIITFFAPACSVNLRIHGEYEIYFNPEVEYGQQGGE
jgi:uncharacterized protein YndB with AHSA1/START domain